jgi:hypothetical protein
MTRETHTPHLLARSLLALLPALVPAILAWLALESLAAGLERPAESLGLGYLARLSAAVLAAAGLLAGGRRQLAMVAAGALAVVATAWLTPPGLPRGAAVVALLTVVLAGSAAAGLTLARDRPGRNGGGIDGLPLAGFLIVLAVGLQLLARSPLLLTPGLAASFDPDLAARLPDWVVVRLELLGLPVLGALAVSVLAARRGLAAALTAGAAACLLGGGWTREGVVCLGVLAAVPRSEEWADPARRRRALIALAAVTVAVAALALIWTRLTAFALLAGLALALAERPRPGARIGASLRLAGLAAVALLALGATVAAGIAPWSEAASRAALVLLAVPVLGMAVASGDLRRCLLGLAAVVFAVVGARTVPGTAALAAPAALAACAALPGRQSEDGGISPGAAFQAAWSALVLIAVTVAAASPWRRADPFHLLAPDDPAIRWGLGVAIAALVAVVIALLGSSRRPDRRAVAAPVAAMLALAVGGLGLALRSPATGTVVLGPGGLPAVTATGAESGAPASLLERRLDPPRPVHQVVVDSFLANAADLPPGTPVATLHLALDGAPDRTWTLRTGDDTGEWAASRRDLAAARLATPAPWASWVAPDTSARDGAAASGPRGFFGQLYRSRIRVAPAGDETLVTEVRITRRPDLPTDTALAVRRVELLP